jgi:hypothetical protein
MVQSELEAKARQFAASRGTTLRRTLGDGNDGAVWETNRKTAVKVFQYQKNYRMELNAYQRLTSKRITKIRQFAVPRFIGSDDNLLAIEMSIVSAPCLIDFGKSYLDSEPDHSAETWAEHHEEQREIWGDQYKEVQAVLWALRQLGIYYRDAKPKNIIFPPDRPSPRGVC